MQDNALVYEMMAAALQTGKKFAVATVVKVYGSAYRREGAKMYIGQDEQVAGMISGGCLEADITEIAKQVMVTGEPVMKSYNMDEDLMWGLGLGCPGQVEIYIEALNNTDMFM